MCWILNLHKPEEGIYRPLLFEERETTRILRGDMDKEEPPLELRAIRKFPSSLLDGISMILNILTLNTWWMK